MDAEEFIRHHLALLTSERDVEHKEFDQVIAKTSPRILQRRGWAVLGLTVVNTRIGFGGKTLVELCPHPSLSSSNAGIPSHAIRTGDLVRIDAHSATETKSQSDTSVEGVVSKVTEQKITVALGRKEDADDKDNADLPDRCMIIKVANDAPYERMKGTLERILEYLKDPTSHKPFPSNLIQVLFGQSEPSFIKPSKLAFLDETLNDSQKSAVEFALSAQDIALIHGPPGTGKTYTVIEIIRQLIQQDKKVLVCGPSNISVDNLVERLVKHRVPLVRIGHPARILPSIQDHALDVLTRTSEAGQIVADVRNELDSTMGRVSKTRSGRERYKLYGEIKELRKEYRLRERKVAQDLIKGAKVVLATCHGAGSREVWGHDFDVCIIDEASQAIEGSCWIPLLAAKKLILAGDPLQLPPTIKSSTSMATPKFSRNDLLRKNSKIPLEVTLFDRLVALYENTVKGGITRMLTIQYRFNQVIGEFPSKELYDGRLLPDETVKDRLLTDLEGVEDNEDTHTEIVFLDTTGTGLFESTQDPADNCGKGSMFEDSKSNEGEVNLVTVHVTALVNAGLRPSEIAVLSPYNAQVHLLSTSLKPQYPGIEVGSIDGMQGREKDAVIVSLVRSRDDVLAGDTKKSNKASASDSIVGFLAEKRRLNVAMTRAKRHLCVVGDSDTIRKGSGYLKRWCEFLEENADVRYNT